MTAPFRVVAYKRVLGSSSQN